MGRDPRLDVPVFPFPIVRRGVDRAACFCNDLDREPERLDELLDDVTALRGRVALLGIR